MSHEHNNHECPHGSDHDHARVPLPSSTVTDSPYSTSEVDPEQLDETLSSTKSVTSSMYDHCYIEENGRTYPGYAPGCYLFPNDKRETERLDRQYDMLKDLFDQRDYFAPLRDPRNILDIGTGTGKWVIDMGNYALNTVQVTPLADKPAAKEFPNAKVVGTDLSPIQPEGPPKNAMFVIDDAQEDDWLMKPGSQDYIHTRLLLGCFEDFREVVKKSFTYLKPGGWMESQEYYTTLFCDDGTMSQDYAFAEWTRTQDTAAMTIGRPLRIANKLKRWFGEQGFVDVHEEIYKLPVNPWHPDPKLKRLGGLSEMCLFNGIQAFSLAWLTRGLGWTKEEVEANLVGVRRAIRDQSVHAYHKVHVVWGRKPEESERKTMDKNANGVDTPTVATAP